ncbi:hypothetical protein [Desulfallas sp. Bu1-1]|uniref:hypothetical protein n=1 Tax=Desulfallas sp. Bu1-1 TaxID=2787620 RepID=UPI001FAE37DA|nr:hypothetical protein [Desulfallas sp. Bu1-1]
MLFLLPIYLPSLPVGVTGATGATALLVSGALGLTVLPNFSTVMFLPSDLTSSHG